MITEVCQYLKNWFDTYQPRFYGKFKIENGHIISINDGDMGITNGQYFRIIGSIFNDGVHTLADTLDDEEFTGAVWLMAIPKDLLDLIKDIEDWQTKYADINSENMSPYQSESFGGYSYSKSSSSGGTSSVPTWKDVFRDRLWRYKKI